MGSKTVKYNKNNSGQNAIIYTCGTLPFFLAKATGDRGWGHELSGSTLKQNGNNRPEFNETKKINNLVAKRTFWSVAG